MNIAIIPARGGSKRIPRKNIKLFQGMPIIGYSIKAALESKLFSTVLVSTDDSEIKEVAESLGAEVPFLRSPKNSDDHATLMDVVEETISNCAKIGKIFQNLCCILATAPLISPERLKEGFHQLNSPDVSCSFTVCEYGTPVQRALRNNHGHLQMISEEYANTRSNDLEKCYFDAGQFYWAKITMPFDKRNFFLRNAAPIILNPLEVQDIDSEADWQLAEFKYRWLQSHSKTGETLL